VKEAFAIGSGALKIAKLFVLRLSLLTVVKVRETTTN